MATETVRQDKDADAKLRYVFDWDAFVTAEGETVASAVVVAPTGIGVAATTVTASTVTITVSGGTEGTTYDIVNRITTSGGQREGKVLQLTIVQTPSASHAITVETGGAGAAANAYASVADGDAYHAGHLYGTAWAEANTAQKEKALIWASRLLDENVAWHGRRAQRDQGLAWPRTGVRDRDGYGIASDTVPAAVVDATAELARALLAADRTAEPATKGYARITVGALALEVDKTDRADVVPNTVARMVAPYGRIIGRGMLRVVRS